ncbi:HET-domain-containing protein [Hypoxylon sp. FL1150]|nr:HET-domain-containing protein [Hypoxylon sp. FL1150]
MLDRISVSTMKAMPKSRKFKTSIQSQSRLGTEPSREDNSCYRPKSSCENKPHSRFTPASLCQRCQPWGQINIHSIVNGDTVTATRTPIMEYTTVKQLMKDSQCTLCLIILEAYHERVEEFPSLQSCPPDRIDIYIEGPYYTDCNNQWPAGLTRQPDVSNPNYIVVKTFLHLEITMTTDRAHKAQFDITPQFKMKYSNKETPVLCGIEWWEIPHFDVKVVRDWLEHCNVHHGTQCVAKVNGNGAPPGDFRLVDAQKMCVVQPGDFVRFVALSYVWSCDPDKRVQLDKSNVDALQAPGSLDKFAIPGIIADAIVLCRDLGERYLWVDRLCIIQDDEITKHNQINIMDRIYSLATFTIVAALNTRTGAGLPGVGGSPRRPRASVWSEPYDVYPPSQGIKLNSLLSAAVNNTLWNKRGWTFQERLLSRRVLFITESQVLFECCRGQAAESLTWTLSPIGQFPANIDFLAERIVFRDVGDLANIDKMSMLQKVTAVPGIYEPYRALGESSFVFKETASMVDYCIWVEDYSSRQLSYGTDILDAFAGVGNSLGAAWNSDMLYGLPEKYLSACLLWHSTVIARRSGDIPSWSWASCLTPIYYSWRYCEWASRKTSDIASLVYFYYQDPSQGLRKHNIEERWIQHKKTIQELAIEEKLPPLKGEYVPAEVTTNHDWRGCPQNPWETFKHQDLNPSACDIAAMFPGSLVFNTTVASLEIDHLFYADETFPERYVAHVDEEHGAQKAMLRNKRGATLGVLDKVEFNWVEARRSTEGSRRYFDFIVLSGGLETWANRDRVVYMDDGADLWLLNVMLVERLPCKPFVARRVAIGWVLMCKWKDCEPRWETVVLC